MIYVYAAGCLLLAFVVGANVGTGIFPRTMWPKWDRRNRLSGDRRKEIRRGADRPRTGGRHNEI